MAKKSNDAAIMKLKETIRVKKAALKAAERFVPVTNCSLQLPGQSERYNINTLTKDTVVPLLVQLNMYKLSSDNLGLTDQFKIGGFSISEWMTDLNTKLTMATRKEEEARLRALEAKLHNLLSQDKKVELELDELAAMI